MRSHTGFRGPRWSPSGVSWTLLSPGVDPLDAALAGFKGMKVAIRPLGSSLVGRDP